MLMCLGDCPLLPAKKTIHLGIDATAMLVFRVQISGCQTLGKDV